MREVAFIRQNVEKWKVFEASIIKNRREADADELASQFIQVTDDLAYAQTFYPKSRTTKYLNGMACLTHQEVYKNKREKSRRVVDYWIQDLPLLFRKHHWTLFYAVLAFFIPAAIGTISTLYDESFVRLILGDGYVNMTLDHIERGDPMAVYKQQEETQMFLRITVNNIRVAFMAFGAGIFLSLGTIWILFSNGVMLGSFMTMFYQEGLFLEAFRVVWIHGTYEISVIVIAGWAGLVLGNSILFPGTYTRIQSLTLAAKDSLKILLSTVPFFIMAGFLEGYVTRHTEMPLWLSFTIILSSFAVVVFFYGVLPYIIKPIASEAHVGE